MSEKDSQQQQVSEGKQEGEEVNANGTGGSDEVAASSPPPPTPPAPKYRHDWYQTESNVCISILIKKVKQENVHVDFQEKMVTVRIDLENDVYNLSLELAHPINVGVCFFKVYSTKVELKLRKCECIRWESLERKADAPSPSDVVSEGKTSTEGPGVHKYPSSSHYTRDWDKLVAEVKQEEKAEKPEGDAALNKLFQQIYQDGTDEVKKAMNKSFSESGGTVLSTNWGEIGTGKVERKPPDGMEWKDYEK